MTGYLVRRLVQTVSVLIGVTFVTFFVMQVLGDPVRLMVPPGTSEKIIDSMRHAYGLDRTVIAQYWSFLTHAIQGDFGESIWLHEPALRAALNVLPHTLMIVLPAAAIGVAFGGLIGIAAGLRPGSAMDKAISTTSYLSISIAEFWLALMLIFIFAGKLGWVAVGGYGADFAHMALPICVLAVIPFAHTAQVIRASVISESQMPYVLTALAKGVSSQAVPFRHVLPNAVIPVMTVAVYDLSIVIFASAPVEVVLAWPGIGQLTVNALNRGDVFLVEAVIVIAGVIIVLMNVIADLIALRLDPRTQIAGLGRAG